MEGDDRSLSKDEMTIGSSLIEETRFFNAHDDSALRGTPKEAESNSPQSSDEIGQREYADFVEMRER